MKKLWLLLLIPLLGGAAFLIRQNLPQKRHAGHIVKARLFAEENNLTAAQQEYEKAYGAGYLPYVSLEVLSLMNRKSVQDRNPSEALRNTLMFVRGNPGNKEGRLMLSRIAFQSGDMETAFRSLDTLLEMDPDYFPGRILLTRIRAAQGRLDLAEEQLRILYRSHPDSLEALLPLAENLLQQGRIAESRGFLRQALADHPGHPQAMFLLIDGYLAEKLTDSARILLADWQGGAGPEMARPIALRRARLEALDGRFPQAAEILRPFAEPKPENITVLAGLATLSAAAGKYDSAVRTYQAMAELEPGSKALYERLIALLCLKAGNPARALEAVKSAQISRKSADLLILNLATYLALGQEHRAVSLIEAQADSLRPLLTGTMGQWVADAEYLGQWALAEYFQSVHEGYRALAASRELQRKWPHNAAAAGIHIANLIAFRKFGEAAGLLEGLADRSKAQNATLLTLYIRSGQQRKGGALAERLLAADPAQAGLNAYLGDLAWSRGDKEKGIRHYRAELANNPEDATALNNLAWEYGIVRGDLEKARPYLDRLEARKHQDARIADTIGWILARNGRTGEGAPYIREALNLVPDHPGFLYHMGYILLRDGKRDQAREHVLKALGSKIRFEERKDAEALLAGFG